MKSIQLSPQEAPHSTSHRSEGNKCRHSQQGLQGLGAPLSACPAERKRRGHLRSLAQSNRAGGQQSRFLTVNREINQSLQGSRAAACGGGHTLTVFAFSSNTTLTKAPQFARMREKAPNTTVVLCHLPEIQPPKGWTRPQDQALRWTDKG